jgi:ubiquinone/menaquinone biosynthesis C-methylase UbiE
MARGFQPEIERLRAVHRLSSRPGLSSAGSFPAGLVSSHSKRSSSKSFPEESSPPGFRPVEKVFESSAGIWNRCRAWTEPLAHGMQVVASKWLTFCVGVDELETAESNKASSLEAMTVREVFESSASFWREVYVADDVYGVIYQERRTAVLSMLHRLALPKGIPVLEVGCGAGFLSVALAKQGHKITATDVAASMVANTRTLADEAGVGPLVETRQCDTHHLPFPDRSFGLVLAIGVLPWVSSVEDAIREMQRVLEPGGYLILTADNRYGLHRILHPYAWVQSTLSRLARALSVRCAHKCLPQAKICSTRAFDAQLLALGLKRVSGATLGFGPFWLLNRVLPRTAAVKLHSTLQAFADRGTPLFRSTGAHYLTLSQRPQATDS